MNRTLPGDIPHDDLVTYHLEKHQQLEMLCLKLEALGPFIELMTHIDQPVHFPDLDLVKVKSAFTKTAERIADYEI